MIYIGTEHARVAALRAAETEAAEHREPIAWTLSPREWRIIDEELNSCLRQAD